MEVGTLMTRMHENLQEIHKTIAGLSIETHDLKINEVEQKRDSIIEALEANFEKEQEQVAIKRKAEAHAISEGRRKEDEEREARRQQEDEERDTDNRADDERRRGLLRTEMRNVEDETEEQLDHIEAEAKQLIEGGRARIRLLEERRREINRLIDEQLKLPLPDIPTRKRDRATKRLKTSTSSAPTPFLPNNEQERSEDQNPRVDTTAEDLDVVDVPRGMQTEVHHIESGDSRFSTVVSNYEQSQGVKEHKPSSLQSRGDELSPHEIPAGKTSSLIGGEMDMIQREFASPILNQELPLVVGPDEPSQQNHHHEAEPLELVPSSTQDGLDLPSAELGDGDNHPVLDHNDPSSSSEACDTRDANINTLVGQSGWLPQQENAVYVSENSVVEAHHSRILPEDTVHISNYQSRDPTDEPESSSRHGKDEGSGTPTPTYAHSIRSQTSQEGMDVSVPNGHLSGIYHIEQSNNPAPVAENGPLTVPPQSLPTRPAAIEEPENLTSVCSDRDDARESVLWGSESRSHSTNHITEDANGDTVATQTSHDDHKSKHDRKLSAATLLEHITSLAQESPYSNGSINSHNTPQEKGLSPLDDQQHTLAPDSPAKHNVLGDTRSPEPDVEDVKLDEQQDRPKPAEGSYNNSDISTQPSETVYSGTTQPDPELDSNNLESSSSLGQIRDLSAGEQTDAYVKGVNLHSSVQQETETSHSTHVGAETSVTNDVHRGVTEVSGEETTYRHDGSLDDNVNAMTGITSGGQDMLVYEDHDLGSNNNIDRSSTSDTDSYIKLDVSSSSSPQLEHNNKAPPSPLYCPYEEETPVIGEAHPSTASENTRGEESDAQQELEHSSNKHQSDTSSGPRYYTVYEKEATPILGVDPEQSSHVELSPHAPPRQASHSPLPVENDTMHGHEDLFDDDAISTFSYENGDANTNDQAFKDHIGYTANEIPDTPRTAVPSFDEQYHNQQEQHSDTDSSGSEVFDGDSLSFRNGQQEEKLQRDNITVLSSPEGSMGHKEGFEFQHEAEPTTPTASLVLEEHATTNFAHQSFNDPAPPEEGLAASRHAPRPRPQTPPRYQSQRTEEDSDQPVFVPRDVTNLSWHTRNDSIPQSMRSESTLSSAPSSPIHSSLPTHYDEPGIREAWSTQNESRVHLRNDSQLTDRSGNDEFNPLRIDANKPMLPSNIDLDLQRRESTTDSQRLPPNRNSLGGAPMFQKIRNLFEAPDTTRDDQANLGSSRPTSAIFTGTVKRQDPSFVKPLDEDKKYHEGYYTNENEDGFDEHSALLRSSEVRTREN